MKKSLNRISINPAIMLGKPCIKDTRITVELLLEKLAGGASYKYLLEGYPNLITEDIQAALSYAKKLVRKQWKKNFKPTK